MTRKIGSRVTMTANLHKTHGDAYFKLNGSCGTIIAIDAKDEDGEQVFGVKIGREFHTVTESMLK